MAISIDRMPNQEVEYYSSAGEVSREEDRVELDIKLLGWDKKMRIRALSFEQMERINKMATITETDKKENKIAGEIDHQEWVYWTIKEGVIIPSFTIHTARQLGDNNGEFIRQLADEIWELGRISKKMWDSYIEEQKRLSAIEKTGNPDATSEDTTGNID